MKVTGLSGTNYQLASNYFNDGGEGYIYRIACGAHKKVAKIYKSGVSTHELEEKLKIMVNNQPSSSVLSQVAWPLDVIYDANKQFCGFVMSELNINAELGDVYTYPSKTNISIREKIIIAQNICVVISKIHEAGYVFGDFNPRNIGVDAKNGIVAFLDTDSYHVFNNKNNKTYRCNVCTPGYSAPELLEKCATHVSTYPNDKSNAYAKTPLPTFTKETDEFALAIHIFKLLMNGFTPFGGIPETSSASQASPGLGDAAVRRDNYSFKPGLKPQSVAIPPLYILPQELINMFTSAFIDGRRDPKKRPSATEWHKTLVYYESMLVNCSADSSHQYDKRNINCPFCEAYIRFNCAIKELPIPAPTPLGGHSPSVKSNIQQKPLQSQNNMAATSKIPLQIPVVLSSPLVSSTTSIFRAQTKPYVSKHTPWYRRVLPAGIVSVAMVGILSIIIAAVIASSSDDETMFKNEPYLLNTDTAEDLNLSNKTEPTLPVTQTPPTTVTPQLCSISLDQPTNKIFTTATVGYGTQTAHNVTINNTGNQATGKLAITLSGTNSSSFMLSKTSINNIAVDSADSFTVMPKTGLPIGTYSAIVTVSGNNEINSSFVVSFTVSAIPVNGVDISCNKVEIRIGNTYDLTAIISPINASNNDLIWSSNNENIATVEQFGISNSSRITAVSEGIATITVKTADGNFTATCIVTVLPFAIRAESVSLSHNEMTIGLGDTKSITGFITPHTVSNYNLIWSSSNENIATVARGGVYSNNARITGVSEGTATITVKTEDGGFVARCIVTVLSSPIRAQSVELSHTSLTMGIGDTTHITGYITPHTVSNYNLIWTSSNERVATVGQGGVYSNSARISAVSEGTATITVKTEDGGFVARCIVTVLSSPIRAQSVELSHTSLTMGIGDTTHITGYITPHTASNYNLIWSSSNENVVTVARGGVYSNNARITGVSAGTATITVKTEDGGFVAMCIITIVN
jgi:uncharacterized protein YjdB